jgi:hypothetical protein
MTYASSNFVIEILHFMEKFMIKYTKIWPLLKNGPIKIEFNHSHIVQNSFWICHLQIGPKVVRILLSIFEISLVPF